MRHENDNRDEGLRTPWEVGVDVVGVLLVGALAVGLIAVLVGYR